jgi:HK97 family phage major capsid protein
MDNEKLLGAVADTVSKTFNDAFEKSLSNMEEVSKKTARQVVEAMLVERAVKGTDITGLTGEQKKDFSAQVIAAFRDKRGDAFRVLESRKGGMIDGVMTKANEALIEEQDNRGGYLVQPEVAAAILRIAASVGTVMRQAQNWPMKTDELGIPNYTGSFLTGQYVGVDLPSTVQGLTFGQAVLIARKWQLPFVVGNDLLADASVQLGEWLLAMAGEALANMIDQQGFMGGTGQTLNSITVAGPFQGIMQVTGTNTYTLATGGTSYNKFDPVVDASNVVAQMEESILDGCAWYMHRTTWAAIAQKEASTSGIPFLFFGAFAANQSGLEKEPTGGPIRPAGHMMGFPVYTNRWFPSYTVGGTSASTNFMVFGNMKAMAFGDKGDMRIGNFQSGVWAGKELGLSDQTGIIYKHRHALVVVLPKAFCVVSTSAS